MKRKILLMTLLGLSLSRGFAQNQNTLVDAVAAGDIATATKLIAEGANLEARDSQGWTPLIIATKATNAEMVRLLIERGADVNTRSSSKTGSTVLCFATESDSPEFINLFLERGARINAQSRNGTTPLFAAVMQKKENTVQFLLSKGAKAGQLALLNEKGYRWTPLMNAAGNGEIRLAELLLDSGASLEKRNNWGETALMLAVRYPNPDMVKFLLGRGANVNAATPRNFTPLIHAIKARQIENIKILLAAGADPNVKWKHNDDPDEEGLDAVWEAVNITHDEELVTLIREAQAKSNPGARKP